MAAVHLLSIQWSQVMDSVAVAVAVAVAVLHQFEALKWTLIQTLTQVLSRGLWFRENKKVKRWAAGRQKRSISDSLFVQTVLFSLLKSKIHFQTTKQSYLNPFRFYSIRPFI